VRSLARLLAAFARCLLAPALIAGAVAGLGAMSAVRAQPVSFGSADDPREPGRRAPWQSARHVALRAGPSLVGPQWRAFLTGAAAYVGPSYATRLEGTLRGGVYGAYDEDADEAYDLVRLVDYARYARSGTGGGPALYTRAGPIQQMTLGPAGHLVHFFRSNTAYDERTVGAEAFAQTDRLSLGLFTDNVLVNGVTGGRLAARPFPGDGFAAPLASTEVGLTAVTDLGLRDDRYADSLETPTALALDASYDATSPGGIALRPFASAAAFADYGWGAGAGAALSGDNFARLARFAVRLGLFHSSDQFTPGAFGALYTVSNPRARLADDSALRAEAPGERSASTPLSEIGASAGWRLGLRLLFFERFELRSSYYGHLGDQDLSRYHLRLFFQTRDGRARLFVRLDRGGLDHVFSVFGAADDQTAVTFNADYRLPFNLGGAGVWAHLRTRYTFERLDDGTGGVKRFLPQRRFEPSVGVRLGL
jgi:hypothetical protein